MINIALSSLRAGFRHMLGDLTLEFISLFPLDLIVAYLDAWPAIVRGSSCSLVCFPAASSRLGES